MSPDLKAMLAPFAEEELHTFRGVGGKDLTYIEDETVMDRLDVGFGMGNWQVHVEPIPVYDGVVKVRLGVRVDSDAEWIWNEDFGYPNNKGADAQSLKEAVSDGIRRCGRYLGIARDLYRKDSPPVVRTNGATAPLQTRSSTALPEGPDLDWDVLDQKKPEAFGTAAAAARTVDGEMKYGELADKAKALKVPTKVLGDTAKRLYGPDAWKLTDLTDVQRYTIAVEVGLV